ncbi:MULTISPECIES: hypothetical protein [unclassified Brevundimonas]|uniref:hypothetical protein n=1 Tax=unclassified Brevundimonas TaxID=2622653 RepID=UPI0011B0148A|nr:MULTISPECIES: hypothetical protein [unclassified Brevundimonas]
MELSQRVGEVFTAPPRIERIAEFLAFVERTGAPQDWPALTTTKHPTGGAPKILALFSIPSRLRGGLESRTPCSICCDRHPKFFEGYLTFLPEEGTLRMMGNRCGRRYFDEGTFQAQEREFNALKVELRARLLLAGCLPTVGLLLQECDIIGDQLRSLIVLKAAVVEALGGQRINALLKSREGDNLMHNLPTERADDRGNRVWERRIVASAPGVGAFAHAVGFVQQLHRNRFLLEGFLAPVLAGGAIDMLTRPQAIAAAEALRAFNVDLTRARVVLSDLQNLFSSKSCLAISAWGQHSETNQKFWIERETTGIKIGHGLKPLHSVRPDHIVELSAEVAAALA